MPSILLVFFFIILAIILIRLVEVWKRVANVLEGHDGTFWTKIEGMDLDGSNKARKLDLLELVMDEVSD